MTTQLYYKTISPRDFGVFAGTSWRNSKRITREAILSACEGRRGNLRDVADFVRSSGAEAFHASAKWYGGINGRWKLDLVPTT